MCLPASLLLRLSLVSSNIADHFLQLPSGSSSLLRRHKHHQAQRCQILGRLALLNTGEQRVSGSMTPALVGAGGYAKPIAAAW
jgi:hypothetical protein